MATSDDTVAGETIEGDAVSWSQIHAATDYVREWLHLKLVRGACAGGLIHQLAGHWCRMPEQFGSFPIVVDVHAVMDQIGTLEGAPMTRAIETKPPERFDTGPLVGLWHKHWFQASFMLHNLMNENEKNGLSLFYRELNLQFPRKEWVGQQIDKRMTQLLAHASVDQAFRHRRGAGKRAGQSRLTGEWIVYAQLGGKNYYLTLAGHGEDKVQIFGRCAPAIDEFPELSQLEPFSPVVHRS